MYNIEALPIAMIVTGILIFLMWLLAEWTCRHPNDSEKKKERK